MGIFDGRVTIITGGGKAKSIGYGIAVAYAKEGASLVLTGRNEKKLLDAKEELERLYNVKVLPLAVEVTPQRRIGGPGQSSCAEGHRPVRPHRRADQQHPGVGLGQPPAHADQGSL
ncbi:SDR family NAD(P)-dependent oxidoreductase [Bittarella massiliensis (ex Durand et al. 2017)]|uniref:SDR family NAD(P)-dependent oxidoreductase n=1 Tax=Bittarella massiliensis (ex Durand et al. 2017) TaxID=1720313 RepID=UPI003F68AFF4